MKKIIAFLFILAVHLSSQAEVKPKMQVFYQLIEKMQNFLVDKKTYQDKKNDSEIKKTLSQFNKNLIELKKEKMTEFDDLKFRFEQLNRGLGEAENSFVDGHKDYSYWILKSSLNNCFGCHTQKNLPGLNYKLKPSSTTKLYAQGEFLYVVRNYADANTIFEKIISNYPRQTTIEELEGSLNKLVYYAVRVKKDDAATIALLDRLLKNESLPSIYRSNILAWKKYLGVKKFKLEDDATLNSAESIGSYISQRNNLAGQYKYGSQRLIIDLETSQKLFEALERNTDLTLKPWLFYWLAYQEKDYRLELFDDSAERYLRECIERFSQSKAAKKCFELFKDMQVESFTGSRGTDIPADVQNTISKYEKMVHLKQ